jgi:hypothetical protein
VKRLICSLVYSRVDTLAAEQTGRNHTKSMLVRPGKLFFVSSGFRFPLFTPSTQSQVNGNYSEEYSVNGK